MQSLEGKVTVVTCAVLLKSQIKKKIRMAASNQSVNRNRNSAVFLHKGSAFQHKISTGITLLFMIIHQGCHKCQLNSPALPVNMLRADRWPKLFFSFSSSPYYWFFFSVSDVCCLILCNMKFYLIIYLKFLCDGDCVMPTDLSKLYWTCFHVAHIHFFCSSFPH